MYQREKNLSSNRKNLLSEQYEISENLNVFKTVFSSFREPRGDMRNGPDVLVFYDTRYVINDKKLPLKGTVARDSLLVHSILFNEII
jgi:hypothetical protein